MTTRWSAEEESESLQLQTSEPPLTNSEEQTPFCTVPFSISKISKAQLCSVKFRWSALIEINKESEPSGRSSETSTSGVRGGDRFSGRFGRESARKWVKMKLAWEKKRDTGGWLRWEKMKLNDQREKNIKESLEGSEGNCSDYFGNWKLYFG